MPVWQNFCRGVKNLPEEMEATCCGWRVMPVISQGPEVNAAIPRCHSGEPVAADAQKLAETSSAHACACQHCEHV